MVEFESDSVPRIRPTRYAKGRPIPLGTRLRKYGLTPEETYAQYAPEGTTPERILFGWLRQHGFTFAFQSPLMGGRAVPGGAIVDFIIYDKFPPLIIRIMSYWHESVDAKWRDQIQLAGLTELGYRVEDVWEYEINTVKKVDQKMRTVLFGAPKWGTNAPTLGTPAVCPRCGDPDCSIYKR